MKNEYARWIEDRYDWFVVLTFAKSIREADARRQVEQVFVPRLEHLAKRRIDACYTVERHASGRPHIHILHSGSDTLLRSDVAWSWLAGHSTVERYDAARHGSRYVVKMLADNPDVATKIIDFDKPDTAITIIGAMPPRKRRITGPIEYQAIHPERRRIVLENIRTKHEAAKKREARREARREAARQRGVIGSIASQYRRSTRGASSMLGPQAWRSG